MYNMQQQQNKYLETTVQTATPAQLLIMLYDGAIRFCKMGIDAIEKQRFADANHHLTKVQDIVKEFAATLEPSSPVADGLRQLYDYFIRRLIEANIQKNVEPAQEVLAFLIELRETWVQAAKTVNQQKNQGQELKHG